MDTSLRDRRLAAGMTQRRLAAASGIPQPNIAAYESGRRAPSAETLRRLEDALSVPTLQRLRGQRERIMAAAEARGLQDVRVFGSVARDAAEVGSDVDLLVHPGAGASIFELAGFMAEVQELLDAEVDVVSDRGTGPTMERIRAEAVPL